MTQAIIQTAPSTALSNALAILAHEAYTLMGALLSPRTILLEVEQMRKLQNHADRIEGQQPQRAAALRRQASLIGLR
jgi:hypothetical protein